MHNLYFSMLALVLGAWCQSYTLDDMNLKYHVSTDAQTWYQALINCKGAGMDLASISSDEEQQSLESFLKENGFNKGYWLSGTNLGNGSYSWASTGEPVVFTKWLPGQPDNTIIHDNNKRGENCIQWGIYDQSPEPVGWNDMFCRQKLQYICQESENQKC